MQHVTLFMAIIFTSGGSKPADIEEDDANDPRAVEFRRCGVIASYVPREAARTVWYFFCW